MIDEVLAVYPEKGKKKRAPHLAPNDQLSGKACVKSNKKTVPGVMSARGCAYAGAKGVVWGPIRDMVHVSHGPVGCGWYSWGTRRNLMSGKLGVDQFGMQFTSDFQEKDIVYGGDKKLKTLLTEAHELFPLAKGISVLSECPVGLIGDDINAVAKQTAKELDIPVIPCNCEGFRGVSQSLGHHIANDTIRDYIIETREFDEPIGPYDIALIGEYNIGGDAWSTKPLLEEMRLQRQVGRGPATASWRRSPPPIRCKLNVIHCYRSMNYMCKVMEEKYGIPWIEYNFFGPTKIEESLRKHRRALRRQDQGEGRGGHRQVRPADAGGHRGVQAAPRRQDGDALRRRPAPAPHHRRLRGPGHGPASAPATSSPTTTTTTAPRRRCPKATVVYDDASEFEMEQFVEVLKPDLVGSGIKEKYVFQKMGLPFRQMHSWDYSGPYHGYKGFPIFARDIDMAINSPTWKLVKAPF